MQLKQSTAQKRQPKPQRLPKGARVDKQELRCPCQDATGLGHCICDDER